MAIFSKELCEKQLAVWIKASEAIAAGQSYQIEELQLTRASLPAVQDQIEYWAGKLAEAENEEKTGGRNRIYHFVPKDK